MRPYVLATFLLATLGFGPGTAQAKGHSTLHCKHGYVKKLVTVKEHKHGHVIRVKATRCVKHHAVKHHAHVVNKAVYIALAEEKCSVMREDLAPAVEATRERNLPFALANPITVAGVIDSSLTNTRAMSNALEAMPRPTSNILELDAYFVAESQRTLAIAKVALALVNEESYEVGYNIGLANVAQNEAMEAATGYGLQVCGQ